MEATIESPVPDWVTLPAASSNETVTVLNVVNAPFGSAASAVAGIETEVGERDIDLGEPVVVKDQLMVAVSSASTIVNVPSYLPDTTEATLTPRVTVEAAAAVDAVPAIKSVVTAKLFTAVELPATESLTPFVASPAPHTVTSAEAEGAVVTASVTLVIPASTIFTPVGTTKERDDLGTTSCTPLVALTRTGPTVAVAEPVAALAGATATNGANTKEAITPSAKRLVVLIDI
jgi:hypothetical protein